MNILVIDDSVEFLRIAEARLAKEGYGVFTATSGAEGLAIARSQQLDLVLLDVDMPGMSGFETCKAFKADSELCMLPIIFLSGSSSGGDKVKGLDMGAVDYITKPFDVFELRARVRAALRTKHMQDLLIKYSQIDPLTELWNRRALSSRMREEWQRIERHGGNMAIIMADIDQFKNVNDTYGHPVGDELLCMVAKVIRDTCRETDVPARYGGEEFAVLCPQANEQEAAELAERFRRGIENIRLQVTGGEVRITASFGVCDAEDVTGPSELITQSDRALYDAKQSGRNRVMTAKPTGVSSSEL